MQSNRVANEKEHTYEILTILTVQRTYQDEYVCKRLFSVFNKMEILERKITFLGILGLEDEEGERAG